METVCFTPGSQTELWPSCMVFTRAVAEQQNILLSPRGGYTQPSCLSGWDESGRELCKLTGQNKADVFFSRLHHKIPRFFLAFILSSPSSRAWCWGGRSTFSNQQGSFKMPWTFEALYNYIFTTSCVQVLGSEVYSSTTKEHRPAWNSRPLEFVHWMVTLQGKLRVPELVHFWHFLAQPPSL